LNLVLLVPLLAYVLIESFPIPHLILLVVVGGSYALWKSVRFLLRPVPQGFTEGLVRKVTPEEAPELWTAVRDAAQRLRTQPPEHILVGMQNNFYVTELKVSYDGGQVEGRTLYLSLPLMKRLTDDEVLTVVGHELGHFIGEDTRMTREFYPFHFRTRGTFHNLMRSGWVAWASVHILNFFSWAFGAAERETSRVREHKADEVAASLTSPALMARTLVRVHIFDEALRLSIFGAPRDRLENPFDASLAEAFASGPLAAEDFWQRLFEIQTPHPLDTHPSLGKRLEALGQSVGVAEARAFATDNGESAYRRWLEPRAQLFTRIEEQARVAVAQARVRVDVRRADYQSAEGRELLEKHFPTCEFKVPTTVLVGRTLLWSCGFMFLAPLAIIVPDLAGRWVTGGLAALCVAGLVLSWRRHWKGRFVLRADSLSYTGWNRPVVFDTVESMQARKYRNSSLRVTFCFREKQPPPWRFQLIKLKRRRFVLNLGLVKANPNQLLQQIYRYMTRQVNLGAPPPPKR
jgi:Zn-dependent protease with chaperone function